MNKYAMGCLAGMVLLAAPLGAQGVAFIAGPGTTGATMNGAPLLPGTAVLPGETITTAAGGTVVLSPTSGTGMVQLGASSSAEISSTSSTAGLQVTQGAAVITGALTVNTAQATFQPTDATSQYVVNAGNGQSSMAVITGDVNTDAIGSGGNGTQTSAPKTVAAGTAVQVSDSGQIANAGFNTVQTPASAVTNTPAASTSH